MRRPFNETKYKALLEGLEVSEVNITKTLENKDFRTDSDFWTKEPSKNPKLIYDKIGNLVKKVQYGISITMNEEGKGYPIYRMNEIHNMFCDLQVEKHASISKEDFNKFKLNDKDVLFNRTNSYDWVGRTGLFRLNDNQDFTFASYLVRFIPDKTKLTPEYLAAFLNTKYGIWDVKRRSRQSINQTNVNPEEVKEIYIPLLSLKFQELIGNNFETAHQKRLASINLYTQAEKFLLNSIGLNNFQPAKESVNVKSFKDSFLTTGRLDAEYYQPKYDNLSKLIQCQKHKSIAQIRTDNFRGLQPVYIENGELDVINSKHILENTLDYGNFEKTSSMFWETQKRARVFKGDILTYTTGANIGRTQVYQIDKRALASNHVNIIRLKEENPFYVGFVLNSIIGRMQTDKFSAGSAQVELYPKDLDQFLIPIVEEEIQLKIVSLVEESFKLKQQSEQLLETARRAVEIAIEQDEEKGMEYIKNKEPD